jgi:hypothetical protein
MENPKMTDPAERTRPFAKPISLLKNLVLGVHESETTDDREARRILDEVLAEVGSETRYEIVKVPWESPEYPLPYLRYSRSSVYGLDMIRKIVERERSFY